MAKKHFIQGIVKHMRKGAFSAKARAAGVSTDALAEKDKHAPGRLGREARLALLFKRFRHKKK